MFCKKCGKKLNDDDCYCSGCGAPVGSVFRHGAAIREERWEGVVFKCPQCGANVAPYSDRCPACGYELRDIGAVGSVKELASKIELAEDDAARAVLVRSFPIPNSREDIIEFLILSVTNIDENSPYGTEEEESLAKAWMAKADQALQKAELVIPDERIYLRSKAAYEKKTSAFSKAQKRRGKRKTLKKGMTEKQTEKVADTVQILGILATVLALFVLAFFLL